MHLGRSSVKFYFFNKFPSSPSQLLCKCFGPCILCYIFDELYPEHWLKKHLYFFQHNKFCLVTYVFFCAKVIPVRLVSVAHFPKEHSSRFCDCWMTVLPKLTMETSTGQQQSRENAALQIINFSVNICLEFFQHFQIIQEGD